ncbi:LysR substrate-binding domain-containing protein [Amycolatopsis sp. NPDC005232]|uniref:LysR substrate-binding domain-containing protein n=1 Tax=Amycolatopsis sp. NPDC005232 TaxID=3157027 RepID=UPI0033B06559
MDGWTRPGLKRNRSGPGSFSDRVGYSTRTREDPIPDALRACLGLDAEPMRHRAGSTLSVLELVAARVGVALVPDRVDRIAVPSVVYRPLSGLGAKAEFSVVQRADETNPAVVPSSRTPADGPAAPGRRGKSRRRSPPAHRRAPVAARGPLRPSAPSAWAARSAAGPVR